MCAVTADYKRQGSDLSTINKESIKDTRPARHVQSYKSAGRRQSSVPRINIYGKKKKMGLPLLLYSYHIMEITEQKDFHLSFGLISNYTTIELLLGWLELDLIT